MEIPFMVKPGMNLSLQKGSEEWNKEFDPEYTSNYVKKGDTKKPLKKLHKRMLELQELLYAEGERALLIILQGMDTCGKDGTIRKVMSGINVQGCEVVNFKTPTSDELSRDYLWRVHKVVPQKGKIGIFNRSHYEDVLVVRVHNLVPESIWKKRYKQINDFERMLVENGTVILKFFLNISKMEQKERLEARIENPAKHWKINAADFHERTYWDDYMQAYEVTLQECSTDWAPWYIIPADKKWYRNLVITERIVETLEDLDMKFPKPNTDVSKLILE